MRGVKQRYASVWRRGFAYLIDIFLLNFILIMPFAPILKPLKNEKLLLIKDFNLNIFLAVISIAVLSYIYFVYLDYKLQRTIGRMVFRIKLKSKGKLTLYKVLIRNITKPFLIIFALDALYMFYKGGHQRYTELKSNTWVENG